MTVKMQGFYACLCMRERRTLMNERTSSMEKNYNGGKHIRELVPPHQIIREITIFSFANKM